MTGAPVVEDGILVGFGSGTADMGLMVGTVTGAPVVGPTDSLDGAFENGILVGTGSIGIVGDLLGNGTGTALMGLLVGIVTGTSVVGSIDVIEGTSDGMGGTGIDVGTGSGSEADGVVDGEMVGGKVENGIFVGTGLIDFVGDLLGNGTCTVVMGLIVGTRTGSPVVGPMDAMEGASDGMGGTGIDVGTGSGSEADGVVDGKTVDGAEVGTDVCMLID